MTGVSGYFWSAYAKAVEMSTAAVESVQNIKMEEVAAAATRAATAALSAIHSCTEVFKAVPLVPQEGEREVEAAEEAEGWVDLSEPGAPPGGAPLKKYQ